jgi:predicted Zn-dependent protease
MFQLASVPLIFMGGGLGAALQQAAGLAIPAGLTKFSRGFEAEADYLGVEYLYKAGYDPQALVAFFERFQAMDKHKTSPLGRMFSNHPQMTDRIRKTQAEISRILPPREAYLLSTSEFDVIKAELLKIANPNKPNQDRTDLPTLRRSTNDRGESPSDDSRPTLKRRPSSNPPSPDPTSGDQ